MTDVNPSYSRKDPLTDDGKLYDSRTTGNHCFFVVVGHSLFITTELLQYVVVS